MAVNIFEEETQDNTHILNEPPVPITEKTGLISEDEANVRASIVAGLIVPEEQMAVFDETKTSLQNSGFSAAESIAYENTEELERIRTTRDLEAIIADPNLSEDQKFQEIMNSRVRQIQKYTLKNILVEHEAIIAPAVDANAVEVQNSILDHLHEVQTQDARLQTEISKGFGGEPFDFWNSIGEVSALAVAPGLWGVQIADVVNKVYPDLVEPSDYVFPGDLLKRVQLRLQELPREERPDAVRQLLNALSEDEYLGQNNDIAKFFVYQSLFLDNQTDMSDEVINDIFGVLDLLPILEVLRVPGLLGKLAKGSLPITRSKDFNLRLRKLIDSQETISNAKERVPDTTVAGKKAQVNPTKAREDTEKAIADQTGSLAKVQGVTREQLTSTNVLPKTVDDPVKAGPDNSDFNALVIDTSYSRFAPEELETVKDNLVQRLKSQASKYWFAYTSKIGVTPIRGGYAAMVRVGADEERGFSTLKEAEKVAKSFKHTGNAVRILARDYANNEFIPLEELKKQKLAPRKRTIEEEVEVTEDVITPTPSITARIAALEQGGDQFKADILKVVKDTGAQDINALTFRLGQMYGFDFPPFDFTARTRDAVFDLSSGNILKAEQKGDKNIVSFIESTTSKITKKVKVPKEVEDLGKREYLIEVDAFHILNPEDTLEEVSPVLDTGLSGWIAKYTDKSGYLDKWLVRGAAIAENQFHLRKGLLVDILKPLYKLKRKDQSKVFAILHQGDRDEVWYTDRELVHAFKEKGYSNIDKLISGYRAVQRHQEEIWRQINQEVRIRLQGEGQKWIVLNKGTPRDGKHFIGKTVPNVPRNIHRMFDPVQGKIRQFTRQEIDDAIEKETAQFIHLRTPITTPGEKVEFVFAPNGSTTFSVRELPPNVINRIPGYITRMHDVNYIIKKKVRRLVNGDLTTLKNEQFIRLDLARTPKEAQEKLESLIAREGGKPEDYKIERADELIEDREYATRMSLEYFDDTGQLFTSTRTRAKEEAFGENGVGLRDIATALDAGRTKAARIGTIDPLVEKLSRNWEKLYGRKFGIDGKMPMFGDLTRQNVASPQDKILFDKAVALRDHIKLIAGVDESAVRRAWKNTVLYVAENVEALPESWRRGLLRQYERNPLNGPKMINFFRHMIMQPIRQLVLQSQQITVYLGVEGGYNYFIKGHGTRDYIGLAYGLSNIDRTGFAELAATKRMAAGMGMTVKEYVDFVEAYRRTGFTRAIDSHQYATVMTVDRKLAGSDSAIRNFFGDQYDNATSLVRMTRRAGFDMGENLQLMGAYLAARNRWMIRNPKKAKQWANDENLSEIVGDTRALSLNMDRTGALQHQRNILGLAAQFTAHASKSMQLLIPQEMKFLDKAGFLGKAGNKLYKRTVGKLSNKEFTDRERAKIAAQQLILYGTAGYGITEGWEQFKAKVGLENIPEKVDLAFNQGMMGTLFNMTLKAFDESSRVAYSESVAPFSNIMGGGYGVNNPIFKLIDGFFFSDSTAREMMLGPTENLRKDIVDTMKFAGFVMGHAGIPEDESKVALILQDFVSKAIPVYNNYLRFRAGEAVERLISATSNEGVRATLGELITQGLIGVPSAAQQSVTALQRELTPRYRLSEEGTVTALDETARDYYNFTKRIFQRVGDNEMSIQEAFDTLNMQAQAMKIILPENEWHHIFDVRMPDLIYNDFNREDMEAELASMIVRIAYEGGLDRPYDDTIARIKAMPPFRTQQEIIEFIESLNDTTMIDQE